MKKLTAIVMAAVSCLSAHGQSFLTRNAQISFYSKTPMEDIKAVNKQVYAAIDLSKKSVAFTLLLKAFLFNKQLMQDHFNENYVESDKYPKASFTGSFKDNIPSSPGSYKVELQGQLTLHGVTKPVNIPATLEILPKGLNGTAIFTVKPSDYNIQIPSLVKEKIASQITIEVKASCAPAK